MATLVSRAIQFARLEPVTGSYDAMLGAGELRLLQNGELRASLAALMGEMGEGFEDEDLSNAVRTEMLMAIAETAPLASVTLGGPRRSLSLPESAPPVDYRALLANRRYTSALTAVALVEQNELLYFERILEDVTAVLELIAAGSRPPASQQAVEAVGPHFQGVQPREDGLI